MTAGQKEERDELKPTPGRDGEGRRETVETVFAVFCLSISDHIDDESFGQLHATDETGRGRVVVAQSQPCIPCRLHLKHLGSQRGKSLTRIYWFRQTPPNWESSTARLRVWQRCLFLEERLVLALIQINTIHAMCISQCLPFATTIAGGSQPDCTTLRRSWAANRLQTPKNLAVIRLGREGTELKPFESVAVQVCDWLHGWGPLIVAQHQSTAEHERRFLYTRTASISRCSQYHARRDGSTSTNNVNEIVPTHAPDGAPLETMS